MPALHPIVWVDEGTDLDEAMAEKLRWMIILPTTALEVISEIIRNHEIGSHNLSLILQVIQWTMVGLGCLLLVIAIFSSTRRHKEGKRRKESGLGTTDKAAGNIKEDPTQISRDVFPEITGHSKDSPGPLRPPRNGGLLRQRSRRGSLPPLSLSDIAE